MFRSIHVWVVSVILSLILGVAYGRADSEIPVLPNAFTNSVPGTPLEKPYWEVFNDSELNALVERGLAGNFDLKAAQERIVQADAIARQVKAPLLPTVSAEAGYTLTPYDTVGMGISIPAPMAAAGDSGDDPSVVHSLQATLKASYMVDITGRSTLNHRAALGDAAAGWLDAESQAAALVSRIVSTYFSVCQAKVQVAIVKEQIETNHAFLEVVEARFDAGATTAVDLLQQRQQLDSAKARLPLVQMIQETSRQQLAVLIGESDISKLPDIPARLPEFGPLPPTGVPKRLLTARADLRARRIRIQNLMIREKSAFRALLPVLSLGGQVGFKMNYAEEMDHGETWSLSALISVPLYQGGSNYAALESARAATRTEIFQMHQAAVNAVGEVESAVTMARLQEENLTTIEQQLETSRITFEEARKRYVVGLSDYLTVLTVLAAYQQIQVSKVQAELDLLKTRIALMNALGGEWTQQLLGKRAGRRP
jgi:outer membrane protein, multidrug efflux system